MADINLEYLTRQVRQLLRDLDSAGHTRFTDETITDALNNALLEVRRVRPDLFLRSRGKVVFMDDPADPLPVEEQYAMSVVFMAVGYVMMRDDQFALDARAVSLHNKGVAQLQVMKA